MKDIRRAKVALICAEIPKSAAGQEAEKGSAWALQTLSIPPAPAYLAWAPDHLPGWAVPVVTCPALPARFLRPCGISATSPDLGCPGCAGASWPVSRPQGSRPSLMAPALSRRPQPCPSPAAGRVWEVQRGWHHTMGRSQYELKSRAWRRVRRTPGLSLTELHVPVVIDEDVGSLQEEDRGRISCSKTQEGTGATLVSG